jgi:hypothetical protein
MSTSMEKFTESSKLNKIVGTDIYFNETFIIEQSKFNFNNCKYLSISSELFRNCIEIKFISVSRDKIEINLFLKASRQLCSLIERLFSNSFSSSCSLIVLALSSAQCSTQATVL